MSSELLRAMLEAANWAPTHGITEPWRFVVLQGEAIDRLGDLKMQHAEETMAPAEFEVFRPKCVILTRSFPAACDVLWFLKQLLSLGSQAGGESQSAVKLCRCCRFRLAIE